MMLSEQESAAISWLRVLAMVSIVTCHFMQALDSCWAWVFNMGVQVFLLISGFLYGHKNIESWVQWYSKRFVRIYIPFLLFFVVVAPLYAENGMINIKRFLIYILGLQGVLGGGLKGIEHLWFITAITLCYAITPLLQWTKRWSRVMLMAVVISAVVVLLWLPNYGYRASWFILYAMGYYLASCTKKEKYLMGILVIAVITYLMTCFSWSLMMNMHSSWSMAFHISGAVLLFLLLLALFSCLKTAYVPRLVKVLDKYSFQIYIVHHILIMPPFGLLGLFDNVVLNIVLIIFYIVIFTWVLVIMNNSVEPVVTRVLGQLKK